MIDIVTLIAIHASLSVLCFANSCIVISVFDMVSFDEDIEIEWEKWL